MRVCPKCGFRIVPVKNRPDITLLHPIGRSYLLELKVLRKGEASFPFARIEPGQHAYLDAWQEKGQAYLGLGIIRPRGEKQTTLEEVYLIPWNEWTDAEGQIGQARKSIRLGTVGEPGDLALCIRSAFAPYKLGHEGKWYVPEEHILRRNNE